MELRVSLEILVIMVELVIVVSKEILDHLVNLVFKDHQENQ